MVVIRQGSEGELQVDSVYYSLFLFLSCSCYPPPPHMHTHNLLTSPRGPLCRISPVFSSRVGVNMLERLTCGMGSNWLIDEHPKQGCGAGPNIFSSDALALDRTLSAFSLLPFPIWNINTVAQTVFNMKSVRVSRGSWPCKLFMVCVTLVFLFYGCFPLILCICTYLSLSLVVHLFAEWLIKFNGASKGCFMSLNRSQYQRRFKATSYLYHLRWQ